MFFALNAIVGHPARDRVDYLLLLLLLLYHTESILNHFVLKALAVSSMINISLRLNNLLSRVSLDISTGALMEAGLQIYSFGKPVSNGIRLEDT